MNNDEKEFIFEVCIPLLGLGIGLFVDAITDDSTLALIDMSFTMCALGLMSYVFLKTEK